jgi:hypothetical protein
LILCVLEREKKEKERKKGRKKEKERDNWSIVCNAKLAWSKFCDKKLMNRRHKCRHYNKRKLFVGLPLFPKALSKSRSSGKGSLYIQSFSKEKYFHLGEHVFHFQISTINILKESFRIAIDFKVFILPTVTNIGLHIFLITNICNLHILHFVTFNQYG